MARSETAPPVADLNYGQLPPFLRPPEAADLTCTTTATLATLRCRGGGPPYLKRGRSVIYETAALLAWLSGDRRMSSYQEAL